MTSDWTVLAACRGAYLDMWDTPSRKSGEDTTTQVTLARQALALCAACPVQPDCDAAGGEVVGVIRAGAAYDLRGVPLRTCVQCGDVILSRGFKFCTEKCQHRNAYESQREREQVAA